MKKLFAQLCKTARIFFYGKGIKQQVEYAMRQLKEQPSLLDFLCFRWTSLTREDTICVIRKAVADGIVTWEELGTHPERINQLYNNQLSSLIELYKMSFFMSHWESYEHAARGLRNLYDIAYGPNDALIDTHDYRTIRMNFAEVIYAFLRLEGVSFEKEPTTLSDEEATSILINEHHYQEKELWIVRRPSTVDNKELFKKMCAQK